MVVQKNKTENCYEHDWAKDSILQKKGRVDAGAAFLKMQRNAAGNIEVGEGYLRSGYSFNTHSG